MSSISSGYTVLIPRKVTKQISRFPKEYQRAIYSSFKSLETTPYLGKKLEDRIKDKYSLRVGVYQILYELFKKELVILIVSVAHRKEVYRR